MGERMGEEIVGDLLSKTLSIDRQDVSFKEKTRAIHIALDLYIEELLQEEKIHFTTLFTKMAFLSLKLGLDRNLTYFLHSHRKNMSEEREGEEVYTIAKFALLELLKQAENIEFSSEIRAIFVIPKREVHLSEGSVSFLPFARIHIFERKDDVLYGYTESDPETRISVKLNVTGKNDDLNSLLRFLKRTEKFPIALHLEDIEVSIDDEYIPGNIIFEPDYLVDITTVSECFKPGESNPLFYFIKKFIPVFQNKYLIVGNIANFFLDELFYNPKVSFNDLLKQTFRLSPLGFSMMNDNEIREVVGKLKNHFYTIKDVVTNQMQRHGINPGNTSLEPSFYSPKYGFQGRLDLYSYSPDESSARIVELKSGKPYKANTYGLNVNHYVQTLLYDLIVRSVESAKLKISSFILYSSQPADPLRFAPPLKVQQKEAIKLRNQLVEIDYLLADIDLDNDHLFSFIQSNAIKSDGFARRDIEKFQKIYTEASTVSKKYFNAFTAFIAREQILAKTGEFGLDKSSGLAGLWLDDMEEKIDNFLVLNALTISGLAAEKSHTIIYFERTSETATNANFRKGDLGVLYPFTHGNKSVLKNQIYKCSIIEITHDKVAVRLRNKQQNTQPFERDIRWHIEHDHLDHGFNAMFQDLFLFLGQKPEYQKKLLGLRAPQVSEVASKFTVDDDSSYMTKEQVGILNSMISAREYYLIWGPPGTGKTSVILYEYLKFIYTKTTEKVLVVAYTNRAVDEICEAINRISKGIKDEYFRIGSRYSTNTSYIEDLLVTKLEDIENRFDLLQLINKSRIIVSTLASIQGKKELFSLVKIDTIIVDEASQILESQLVGFLSLAPKFILIGDHYQLPAIVRQREDESVVIDEELNALGLQERRNSLFERLYNRSLEKEWTWAYGRLTQQGRMHEDIMGFVNVHFYKNLLSVIPSREDLTVACGVKLLFNERLVYHPVDVDHTSINYKTNNHEARAVSVILKKYMELDPDLDLNCIGIITPYRAQISAIKLAIREEEIDHEINVDTVERFQGGARDIIILSLCLNIESQLKQLVNLSSEGIDRKLNVALTRARKQIIVLGNENIMRANKVYSKLIDSAKRVGGVSSK